MKTRTKVLHEVAAERKYQDKKWGGPTHDDTESEANWIAYINKYAIGGFDDKDRPFRERMVKVAALAVAAIESHDRKNAPAESVKTEESEPANENPTVEAGESGT